MIPLRLRLSNFMCYRDNMPPLELSGIRLACLSGPNGHGKSTLLDAITWALWGKARNGASADALIALGQNDMEVEFDFALGPNEYRVLRKRTKRGRTSQGTLDLQIRNGDGFRSISEPTAPQTQELLIRTLRMNYETFINSAFIVQGHADEFTKKTAADRKRILGDILGLSLYDDYERRVRDRSRDAESSEKAVTQRIVEIDRDLGFEAQYQKERQEAGDAVQRLTQESGEVETRQNQLQQTKKLLDLQKKQADQARLRLTRIQNEVRELSQELAQREQRIKGYESVLSRRDEIEAGSAAWQAAREQERELNAQLLQLSQYKEEQSRWEQRVSEARIHLESQRRVAADRAQELAKKVVEGSRVAPLLEKARQRLEALAQQEAGRERQRRQLQELSNEAAGLDAENQRLRQDMAELKQRMELLKEAEAKCPLCHQALAEAEQARLTAEMETEGRQKGDLYRQHMARLGEIKTETARLEAESAGVERELRARAGLQREEASYEQALAEADRAQEEIEATQVTLQQLEAQLGEKRYAPEALAALARLREQLAALGYDPRVHEAVRAQVEEGRRYEKEQQQLAVAARLVEEERASAASGQARLARREEERQKEEQGLAEFEGALTGAAALERELGNVQRQLVTLREQERVARERLGGADQKLRHCQGLRGERETQVKRLRQVSEERGLYQELQIAFGQKGVRAMIIECVIPEIEEEANRLLARMTENRMHLRFETQRETLKGDTVETLEIKISDELGTRDYEMYSGGEAFRVNFALRIALSKLLARRAGAQLQTLIIDEGFGTQDTQGRERLLEAISSIRDDFACILVITHIEELQDAFPVRLNVVKTAEGSRVEIV